MIEVLDNKGVLQRGHRSRLRERFFNSSSSLHDYEILELILCMAQPRIDVRGIAKKLIRKFGSFADVVCASKESLLEVEGMGNISVCALKIIHESTSRILAPSTKTEIMNSSTKVLKYLRASMAHLQTEQFRVLYLSSKNALIKNELQKYGTIDEVPLYPRELMRSAMNYGASALILVHNHPSGDPRPSHSDMVLTTQIYELAKSLKIQLHDHLIIAKRGHYSFRAEGILGMMPEEIGAAQ